MTIDVTVPALGESVTEATVAKWFKAVGEPVAVDEPLCELETDKVALEVFASTAGTLAAINAEEGATVEIGALLGQIAEGGGATIVIPWASNSLNKEISSSSARTLAYRRELSAATRADA